MNTADPKQLYDSLTREWPLAPLKDPDEQAIFDTLSLAINDLILHDQHRLMAILYRIDVSESRIRQWLGQHKGVDASRIIAQLIIDREKEKIRTREAWGPRKGDVLEDEQW